MSESPTVSRIPVLRGASWCLLLLSLACDALPGGPTLDLPRRPGDAPGGGEIARELRSLDLAAREARIYAEISSGNVPARVRRLERVEMTAEVAGREHRVTFWATPDYLALGSDDDSFLVPLTAPTAQRVADLVGASLPTPPMVDAIWSAAGNRLAPIRLRPYDSMKTVRQFVRHDRLVGAQRQGRGVATDAFVAGHKKDIVLSATLADDPGKVAIYGWHQLDGVPIQPVNTVLADDWVGYNHGVRLVSRRILVDGERRDLWDVLRDPELAPLLSDGGVIADPRYPVAGAER